MNKWMKKLTAALCAAVLMCGMAVTAYAGGGEEWDGLDPVEQLPTETVDPGEGFTEDGNLVTRDLLYDKDAGCLPLDAPCYMLGKCWTGAYCRYFCSAVLPLDPVLERSLTVERVAETRPCPVCGRAFLPDGRQRYCSPACARAALREQKRAYMRRKRR